MQLKRKIILVLSIALTYQVFAQDNFAKSPFQNPSDQNIAQIELFPNPAVDFVVVQISNNELRNPEIELRSMIGNRVNVDIEKISTNKYRVPLKDFASGYYFLIVKDEYSRFKKAIKFLKR